MDARPAGADQRPHQPHRRLPARGSDLRRPDGPVREAPPRHRAQHRPDARRGRVTPSSAARTTRPRPRCRWRSTSADTSSACRPLSRRSPPARPAWRSSGFSLITNLAAGIQQTPLSHAEVIEAGREAEPVISALLARGGRGPVSEERLAQARAWLRQDPRSRDPRRARRSDHSSLRRGTAPPSRNSTTGSARASSSEPPASAGELGAGRQPDEPRPRGASGRGIRRVPAREGGSRALHPDRRDRLRRPPELPSVRHGLRRTLRRCRSARDPAAPPAADPRARLRRPSLRRGRRRDG